jgi:nucleoid DNA-binding protein
MSQNDTRNQVKHALAEIVRETLEARQDIQVPGLGSFRIVHHAATRMRTKQGGMEFIPPRNEIRFTPQA